MLINLIYMDEQDEQDEWTGSMDVLQSFRRNFTSKTGVFDCKKGAYLKSACLVHGNNRHGIDLE